MNCEPKNERYMPYNIEPPQVAARAHCVINGTEKCCGRPWWEDDDWNEMDFRRRDGEFKKRRQ